jgi:predicted RNA binding protein with dsRBD fold (UPF0201 family)
MRVKIRAHVFPSEDEEKIMRILNAMFPEAAFERQGDELEGSAEDLPHFRKQCADYRIRATIHAELRKSFRGGRARLLLNKQVARPNVYLGHSLGPVEVIVEAREDEIERLVWGSERPADSVPIGPQEY